MISRTAALALLAFVAALATACAGTPKPAPTPAPTAPATAEPEHVGLPPIERVSGAPLAIRVISPDANQSLGRLDSTFVFGSVGSGDATLTINGRPVPVAANGAFLGYVAVPQGASPRYELVAARGADTARRAIAVRIAARRALPADGRLVVDTSSVAPTEALMRRGDEPVRISIRAPRTAQVWITGLAARGDSTRVALVDLAAARGTTPPAGDDAATTWVTELPARLLASPSRAQLVAARGADTVRLRVARVTLAGHTLGADAIPLRDWVMLGRPSVVPDTDRVVVGRPTPDGTYRWFFLPGTIVERTGAQGDATRVRLDDRLEVWVASTDVVALPPGAAPPRRAVGSVRVVPSRDWVDVTFAIGERPPYDVVERGRDVELTLFGTQLTPEILPILGTATDSLVRQVVWTPEASDRVRITLRLSQAPYGYLVLWDATRGTFTLRLRRVPTIDPRAPLRGLTIVVDAGHPPGGATGATGLTEPVAVLPVAERVRDLLRERGAAVVMTRTTAGPVALGDRGVMARRANGHAFVSVHLNAFPDGVNPFTNAGTSTLFFHQHSEPLARRVQRELVRRFAIRDLGVHYQNLAVARPPWMPAVLTEGLFLMVPEQEAALRSAAGRDLYARGIVAGLEAYFRDLADGRD